MKELIKKFLRRMLGWYIEPLYQENTRMSLEIQKLLTQIEKQVEQTCGQFEEQDARLSGIEGREEWTRGRFEEQDARFSGIEGREEWTRGRFEEQDARFSGIEGREEWTRRRFEEQDARLSGIEGREAWTRGRFEAQDTRSADQEFRLRQLDQRFGQLQQALAAIQLQGRSMDMEQMRLLTFAQSGEDAIAAYILRFLQKPVSEITYLDLGANHAKELSNTYYFYLLGARGVLVEANPELIAELERERPGDIVLNTVIGSKAGERTNFYVLNGDGLSTVSLADAQEACRQNPELFIKEKYEIETCTINQILQTHFESAPTILSIDLEGIEEGVLRSIDFDACSPWIIILENIPYTPLLTIDQREFRCVDFLRGKGYTEYAFTGINSIFVLKKAVREFNERRMRELKGE